MGRVGPVFWMTLIVFDVRSIYSEYLAPGATDPVNVDSRVADIVRRSIEHQMDRYCLDEAEVGYASYKNNLKRLASFQSSHCISGCSKKDPFVLTQRSRRFSQHFLQF